MHFLREALYKKPLEPRYLVYFRGGTAITMGCLFLAFCGFLISQIHNDQPLIVNSSEVIETYIESPDIELCIQNSTLSMVKCSAMYYNWTTVDIENCWSQFFRPGANGDSNKCYVFESNGTYRMATGVTYDSRDALRRLDFYWNIDSLYNISFATTSIPAIAVQLYDPHFSSWKSNTVGNTTREQITINNIKLGATRATTMVNHSSVIYYSPQKYRAIKPADAASVIGFTPNYIDIMTLLNFQQNWPLNPTPPPNMFNRSLYQGMFSVQLAQASIDVKTEVRQHSLLASIALAGGCYGVLTTIYILLFGMTRLTPWGLVHHIPVFISKRKHAVKYIEGDYVPHEEQGLTTQNTTNKSSQLTMLIPWFFRQPLNGKKTYTSKDKNDTFLRRIISSSSDNSAEKYDISEVSTIPQIPPLAIDMQYLNKSYYQPHLASPTPDHYANTPPQFPAAVSSSSANLDIYSLLNAEKTRSDKLEEKSTELANRVKELEAILSEYFIDTAYIDSLRNRKGLIVVEEDSTGARTKNLE